MAEATIAAGFAKALIKLAVAKGANQELLLERSNIDPKELRNQDNRIPLKNYLALLKAGMELCNEPALALKFGEEVGMPQLSIVGLIVQAAGTMGEAFLQGNRYARLIVDGGENEPADLLEITRNGDQVWLELKRKAYRDYPHLTESSFARMFSGFANYNKPVVKAVHVTWAEPIYRSEYDRIFKVPVVFESDKNALLIDETFLSLKIPGPNRYVFGILTKHADALLKRLESSETLRGKVESLLIPILHTGNLKMERIAGKLGISRQTLYRKLKAEGVSYEKLLDELRHKMALQYLNGKKVSVNETAYLVGFSEPSAFSRAFKRWTGSSPGHYKGDED